MNDHLHKNVRSGLRATLLTVVKAAVAGITTLSATKLDDTTAEFAWTAGLFATNNFAPGDEVVMSGWATAALNGTWFLEEVSETMVRARLPQADIEGGRITATEAAGQSITVTAGWPTGQADENVSFDGSTGEPWVREAYKGGPETRRSLATYVSPAQPNAAFVRLSWLYMLNVMYPAGLGMSGVDGLIDALRGTVYPGKLITYNSQSITILSVSRQGSAQEADFVGVPVSIRGFANTLTP